MKYPYQIAKLSGLNSDLPASESPPDVFTNGKNIRYDNNSMCKFDGHKRVFDAGILASPYHAFGFQQPLDYFWMYGGASTVSVVGTSGSHNDITPASGVTATYDENWNHGIINGVPYMNNVAQNPIWWDGQTGNLMTDLTGWPANTKAKVIRTFNNYLLALDLTESSNDFPNRLRWSSSADAGAVPQSWDETDPTLDAGLTTLAGTQGPLIDCLQLYEDNIIYKNDSAFVMSFVGGQQIFSFRELFHDIGILARNCVAYWKGRHAIFTQDDIMIHDGRTAQSIVDKRMRSYVFNSMDFENATKSFVVPYHKKDEIWYCFPNGESGTDGLPNIALVWNYKDDKHSLRDLQDTPFISPGIISQFNGVSEWDNDNEVWNDDASVWNENQIGSVAQDLIMCSGSYLQNIDIGATFDGTEFQSFVEKLSYPLSDNYTELKLVRKIRPYIDGTSGAVLKIRLGGQMNAADPIAWGTEGTFTIGIDIDFDCLIKGRLISMKISSETGTKWTLHRVEIQTKSGERY